MTSSFVIRFHGRIILDNIFSSPLWETFVSHRFPEISRLEPFAHWYHIEGADNLADLTTRGITTNELIDSRLCGVKALRFFLEILNPRLVSTR